MKTPLKAVAVCLTLCCSCLLAAGTAMAANEVCCRIGQPLNIHFVWLNPVDCAEAHGTVVADTYCPKPPSGGGQPPSGGSKIKKSVALESVKKMKVQCCLEPGKKPFKTRPLFPCKGMYVPMNYCVD